MQSFRDQHIGFKTNIFTYLNQFFLTELYVVDPNTPSSSHSAMGTHRILTTMEYDPKRGKRKRNK